MDDAAQEGAGRYDKSPTADQCRSIDGNTNNAPRVERYAGGLAFDDAKVRCFGNQAAHCRLIKPTIHLRPRALNCRPLSTVEHAKLNSCGVCGATHETVKRVDFPDKVSFSKATYRRIARHRAYRAERMRHERCLRAESSGGGRRFTAGVPAADNRDIEVPHASRLNCFT